MTAEVVVLNKGAVALAADSAVTITDSLQSKVYNTVNKLFTLSKFHPVGIMVYGNADYMGIPWETIIKLYRTRLGKRAFPKIEMYAKDFLSFVDRSFKITSNQQKQKAQQIFLAYFEEINRSLRSVLLSNPKNKKQISLEDVTELFTYIVDNYISRIQKFDTLSRFKKIKRSALLKQYQSEFEAARDRAFRGRPMNDQINDKLKTFAHLLIIKSECRRAASGIVIAGFGAKDIFPGVSPSVVVGKINNISKVVYGKGMKASADPTEDVIVRAFAQDEMVFRFMEGIDEGYSNYLKIAVSALSKKLCSEILMKHGKGNKVAKETVIKKLEPLIDEMISEFEARARRHRYEKFVRPVLNIVSILPKDELAELAGALVNITSLKRRISMDTDSVGGPIDVAVISKGDGFVWIRRKHYFKSELNPSFLQKYLTG